MIPLLANKKLLQIKLRDYPKTQGLPVINFVFSGLAKAIKNSEAKEILSPPKLPTKPQL